jgi:hypothetical protein
MYCTASQTDGDTSMAGAGDEGAAGVAAPAIALGAWILLTPAMFSGTVLAAFALARTAGSTQLEATVMRRAKLRKVHGPGGSIDRGRCGDGRGPHDAARPA